MERNALYGGKPLLSVVTAATAGGHSGPTMQEMPENIGGDGGIRTLDRALQPYNGLANRRLQPLGHISGTADMPDAGAGRKRQIAVGAACEG